MARKESKEKQGVVESILDLNASNIWSVDEYTIATLWEEEKKEEGFSQSEERLLNIIRLAFDVIHYDHHNDREAKLYEKSNEWSTFSHASDRKGYVAIRRKKIVRITDLSYENVKHITASTLLDLIDKNFGGGWDAIPLSVKDVIESAFDISTTQLPASRIHAAGGTMERKVAQGFEVLEIVKGTWIEAIFAKKKELVEKIHYTPMPNDEEDRLDDEAYDDEEVDNERDDERSEEEYYSSYIEEAEPKDDDEEGFPLDNLD